VVTSTLVHRIT